MLQAAVARLAGLGLRRAPWLRRLTLAGSDSAARTVMGVASKSTTTPAERPGQRDSHGSAAADRRHETRTGRSDIPSYWQDHDSLAGLDHLRGRVVEQRGHPADEGGSQGPPIGLDHRRSRPVRLPLERPRRRAGSGGFHRLAATAGSRTQKCPSTSGPPNRQAGNSRLPRSVLNRIRFNTDYAEVGVKPENLEWPAQAVLLADSPA